MRGPMRDVFAVVLAGGSGTRFWPASRRALPKQLLAIASDGQATLISETVRRVSALCPAERILIATGAALLEATRRALPQLPATAFLAEPHARNTAACIGWAARVAQRRCEDALLMVVPSDHHIGEEPAFRQSVALALASADRGVLTLLGIVPTRPDSGYGYIEVGAAVSDGVHRVARFVEKPQRAEAQQYVDSGRFLWNGGMFFFRAASLREAIAQHLPELSAGLDAIDRASERSAVEEAAVTEDVFASLPAVSFDHGIVEKVSPLHVVPGNFAWSDVGSWQSAWELADRDATDNAAPVNSVLLDARGNLVRDLRRDGVERTIALVGIDNLCVIETDDALLIIPRERAQDVRLVVDALAKRGETNRL